MPSVALTTKMKAPISNPTPDSSKGKAKAVAAPPKKKFVQPLS